MNAGLDADQPTPAMTPKQMKSDAARLRGIIQFCGEQLRDADHGEDAKHWVRWAGTAARAADFLDSLTVETRKNPNGWPRNAVLTTTERRFISPWTEQPTTEEEE